MAIHTKAVKLPKKKKEKKVHKIVLVDPWEERRKSYKPPVDNRPNDEVLVANGFDKKTSFRK
jgi:hypothetical protein